MTWISENHINCLKGSRTTTFTESPPSVRSSFCLLSTFPAALGPYLAQVSDDCNMDDSICSSHTLRSRLRASRHPKPWTCQDFWNLWWSNHHHQCTPNHHGLGWDSELCEKTQDTQNTPPEALHNPWKWMVVGKVTFQETTVVSYLVDS